MKKLPAVSEMEHITSKEFGENMDAILERVAKENIALIIDHADNSFFFRCFVVEGAGTTGREKKLGDVERDLFFEKPTKRGRNLRRFYLRRALPRFSKSSWARSPMAAAARGAR